MSSKKSPVNFYFLPDVASYIFVFCFLGGSWKHYCMLHNLNLSGCGRQLFVSSAFVSPLAEKSRNPLWEKDSPSIQSCWRNDFLSSPIYFENGYCYWYMNGKIPQSSSQYIQKIHQHTIPPSRACMLQCRLRR